MAVILVLGRMSQEDYKFKARLDCIARSCFKTRRGIGEEGTMREKKEGGGREGS